MTDDDQEVIVTRPLHKEGCHGIVCGTYDASCNGCLFDLWTASLQELRVAPINGTPVRKVGSTNGTH